MLSSVRLLAFNQSARRRRARRRDQRHPLFPLEPTIDLRRRSAEVAGSTRIDSCYRLVPICQLSCLYRRDARESVLLASAIRVLAVSSQTEAWAWSSFAFSASTAWKRARIGVSEFCFAVSVMRLSFWIVCSITGYNSGSCTSDGQRFEQQRTSLANVDLQQQVVRGVSALHPRGHRPLPLRVVDQVEDPPFRCKDQSSVIGEPHLHSAIVLVVCARACALLSCIPARVFRCKTRRRGDHRNAESPSRVVHQRNS